MDESKFAYIMQEKWDYLIILDACRYDYFERFYGQYLNGRLEKRLSVGSCTPEWRNKSFPEFYQGLSYISANPFINSQTPMRGFLSTDHFSTVHDLWLNDWDPEKKTVPPEKVTQRAKEIAQSTSYSRMIIHYMQPHEPYLVEKYASLSYQWLPPANPVIAKSRLAGKKPPRMKKAVRIISNFLRRTGLLGWISLWRIRSILGMPPLSHFDAIRRKYGKEGIREAYRDNLKIVLESVQKLVENLSGTIIVTSDHGEMLGEGGSYGHWKRSKKKTLREIPWLVIDKGPKKVLVRDRAQHDQTVESEISDKDRKKQVQDRLRALGYY
jgi:hypothetical protein